MHDSFEDKSAAIIFYSSPTGERTAAGIK